MSDSIQPKYSMDGFLIESVSEDETILDKIRKNLKLKKFPENATLWRSEEINNLTQIPE